MMLAEILATVPRCEDCGLDGTPKDRRVDHNGGAEYHYAWRVMQGMVFDVPCYGAPILQKDGD